MSFFFLICDAGAALSLSYVLSVVRKPLPITNKAKYNICSRVTWIYTCFHQFSPMHFLLFLIFCMCGLPLKHWAELLFWVFYFLDMQFLTVQLLACQDKTCRRVRVTGRQKGAQHRGRILTRDRRRCDSRYYRRTNLQIRTSEWKLSKAPWLLSVVVKAPYQSAEMFINEV